MEPLFKLFSLVIILNVNAVIAQTTFAPAGAEWYHNMQYGLFYSYNAGDTIINGINCRIVKREARTSVSVGLTVHNLPTIYLYNNTDTVFVYNYFFNRFTPLYVFNVIDGDTVHLPILPTEIDGLHHVSTDSTFSFIVDSVRTVIYDTAHLKTIYTRSYGNRTTNYVYSYGPNYTDTLGRYAEKIGGISEGLMPRCLTYVSVLDDSYQLQDSIRCYNDSVYSIKVTTGTCGMPGVLVPLNTIDKNLIVSPNPVYDILNLRANNDIGNIIISNVLGEIVYNKDIKNKIAIIKMNNLPNGVYIISVNGIEQRRIIKQ